MAKGIEDNIRAERHVTLLRGRREGLEVMLAGSDLTEALSQLEARLAEQPSFYRGSTAIANFGAFEPSAQAVRQLRDILKSAEIALKTLRGSGEGLDELALQEGLAFEAIATGNDAARAAARARREVQLSDPARSPVADFAGARSDIAQRRQRGEASVPRVKTAAKSPRQVHTALHVVEAPPATLYHDATLRGGQVLHHTGNIVVVGDVNPGAELVATGDVVVFGRLGGVAHAGAGGDEAARIYAVDLAPTQLRIASLIAAESDGKRRSRSVPEAALVRDGRIVVVALDRIVPRQSAGASHG